MWCEVTDDPVVVNKLRPAKPGNRLEAKTATTSDVSSPRDTVQTGDRLPKASVVAKGRSFEEVFRGDLSNNMQHQ